MSDDLQRRADVVFLSVVQAQPAERDSILEQHLLADPEATEIARRMIRDWEAGVAEATTPTAFQPPDWARERTGSLAGPWTIEGLIRQGGFGRIYRAVRTVGEGSEMAALKFLDMAPEAGWRFKRECQALAELQYPGICRFLDAGQTSSGDVYLAMELVDGADLLQYCREERLSLNSRLRLFLRICEAVEYAHDHRVLHRDLKPDNIMVTRRGEVRVLDFGLAKVLEESSVDTVHRTRTGESLGTPYWASPEQVTGDRLSHATDVYGLGTVLYELVTGNPVFESSAPLNAAVWAHTVKEQAPTRPSMKLPESPDASSWRPEETTRRPYSRSLGRWRRAVQGNLDEIILKALAKKPDDRYQRVDRLRMDVERYLAGSAVTARHTNIFERVYRWSVMNSRLATAVWATALALFALVNYEFVMQMRYEDQIRREQETLIRLRQLLDSGLPNVEAALAGIATSQSRLAAVRVHGGLLHRIEGWPPEVRAGLEESWVYSALVCAQRWRELGDSRAALRVVESPLARVRERLEGGPRDPHWTELGAKLLRLSSELHREMGEEAAATDSLRQLRRLEEGGR